MATLAFRHEDEPAAPDGAHPLARELYPIFAEQLVGLRHETLVVAGCDASGRLLVFNERIGGALSIVSVVPAIREALGCPQVTQLVMAHNHPCGTLVPSRADRLSTQTSAALARLAGARLVDHWLFAGGKAVSFRSLGLL